MAQHVQASGTVDVSKIKDVLRKVNHRYEEYRQQAGLCFMDLWYIEQILNSGTSRDTATAMSADEVKSDFTNTLNSIKEILNHAKGEDEDPSLRADATEALLVLKTVRQALRARQISMDNDSASRIPLDQSATAGEQQTARAAHANPPDSLRNNKRLHTDVNSRNGEPTSSGTSFKKPRNSSHQRSPSASLQTSPVKELLADSNAPAAPITASVLTRPVVQVVPPVPGHHEVTPSKEAPAVQDTTSPVAPTVSQHMSIVFVVTLYLAMYLTFLA